MERVKYNPSEFVGEYTEDRFGKAPVFHPPVTPKANYEAMFEGKNPLWMPMTTDCKGIDPRVDPDNIARAFVFDGEGAYDTSLYGGKDMFGIEWVFVPVAGGSMVKPGAPLMADANDWKDLIKFPDLDSWDWEGCLKGNTEWMENNKDYVENITFLNGTGYERLISFMDFEGAAMSLIDEDQQDAVKELFDTICEKVYFPYLEKVKKYLPGVTKITLHDDWGSQRAPFFSLATAREMLVPVCKKFTDKCKEMGYIVELHSCGKNDLLVPAYIEAGFQTWNGMYMNDKRNLFEQYGDQFIFGVDPPAIADDPNASKEDLWAAAKEFCEFYIRDGKCHVVANCMRKNPDFIQAVYEISRQMLNP
mgnify:FL=1